MIKKLNKIHAVLRDTDLIKLKFTLHEYRHACDILQELGRGEKAETIIKNVQLFFDKHSIPNRSQGIGWVIG